MSPRSLAPAAALGPQVDPRPACPRPPDCNDGTSGYSVFGITAWKDRVFGFARANNLGGLAVAIDNDTAEGCIIKAFSQELVRRRHHHHRRSRHPPPK
ncbi:MAG: hypothetical protein R3B70_29535 [Polyangiaceae bacterium]